MYDCARVMLDGYRGDGERALGVYRNLLAPAGRSMPAFIAITAARAPTYSENFTEAQEIFELLERGVAENSVWYPIVPILRAELEIRIGNLHLVPEAHRPGEQAADSRRADPGAPAPPPGMLAPLRARPSERRGGG